MKRLALWSGHVDLDSGAVTLDGRTAALRPAELLLLRYLSERPNRTIGRDELRANVFGAGAGLRVRALATTVGRLRRRIERMPSAPRHLVTERHVGYRFVPMDDGAPARHPVPHPVPLHGVLVGRDTELATVASWLAGERLVAVVGPPGVGATSVARALAGRLQGSVWLADGAEGLPEAGIAVIDDPDEMALAAILAQLAACPDLRVVLTTRRPPPSGARVLELAPLSPAHGTEMALALAEQLGVPLSTDAAARIAVRSDGLPLAIRHRVSLLRTEPIAHVLSPAPLPELVEEVRGWLARCSVDEVATLSALAVVRGRFGGEEAEAVLGPGFRERLAAVRDRGLLVRDGDDLRLLSVVRDAVFADDPGPYRRWLVDRAAARAAEVDGPNARAALDWLGARMPDLDDAVVGLASDPAAAERAALARDAWIRLRGGRGRLAALDEAPPGPAIHVLRSAALRDAGDAAGARSALDLAGDGPDSRIERCTLECLYGTPADAEAALRAASARSPDRRGAGRVALAAGTLARRQDDLEGARERFGAALGLWRSAGLDRLVGLALSALSTPEILEGRLEAAATHLSEAVDVFAAAGDLRNLAPTLEQLGIVSSDLGRWDEAEAAWLECLRFETEAGRMPSVANLMARLAMLAHERGRLDLAEQRYREAIGLLREHSALGAVPMPLASLALLLIEQGRKPAARAACDEARALADTHVRPRAAVFARLVGSLLLPPERAREEITAVAAAGPDDTIGALLVACRARVDGDRTQARARLSAQAEHSAAARIALRVLDFDEA